MSKDILYRPELEYEKSYYTEGHIESDINSNPLEGDSKPNRKKELSDLINKIKNNFELLPPQFIDVFLPPFIGTAAVISEIPDIYKDPEAEEKKEKTIIDIPIIPDGDLEDDGLYDPFGKTNDIYVNIEPEPINVEEQLRKQYSEDLMEIVKDYFIKLNNAMEKYIYNSILSFGEISNKKDKMLSNVSTKNVKDSKLHHLSDFITKSEIMLKQKLMISKKLYDIDETIVQLRICRISNEQRVRYAKIKEQPGKTKLESTSNKILRESQIVSQKKYEENFFGLYKYLNSSVILLNECTNTLSKQNYAKALINEKERD